MPSKSKQFNHRPDWLKLSPFGRPMAPPRLRRRIKRVKRASRGAASLPHSLIQAALSVADAEDRKAAIVSLMSMIEQKKEMVEAVMKERVEKMEERVGKLQQENAHLQGDLLRERGLLTARSVFERVVELGFCEQVAQGNAKGKCVVTNALPVIVQHPAAGWWSGQLLHSAKACVKKKESCLQALQDAYGEMSRQIHQTASSDVELPKVLSKTSRGIATNLCEAMGLKVYRGHASPWTGFDRKEKERDLGRA